MRTYCARAGIRNTEERIMNESLRKVTVAVMAVLCVISVFGGLFGCAGAVEIKDISRFEFWYETGNAMNASVRYTVENDGESITATVKPDMEPDESSVTYNVSSEFLGELEAILVRFGVGKWNGFSGNSKGVLDGKSFHLYLTNGKGEMLEARGYAKFPSHYREVRDELDALFSALGR